MITVAKSPTYFHESRMRTKLSHWNLPGIPREVECRAFKRFALTSTWCQQKITSVYFRTLWNGWVTDRRMASLLAKQGQAQRGCVLGCGWDEDSIEHYSGCKLYWNWVSSQRPLGLGIDNRFRSRAAFLLLHPQLSEEDAIRMALGMYALHMTTNECRHKQVPTIANISKILSLWAKRGAEGSKAKSLLQYHSPR